MSKLDSRRGWRQVIWSCAAVRGPLLTRYYVVETRWFAVYLHHLHTSDEDRALHDHPWSFVTFLISGGYEEHTPAGVFWRRRFRHGSTTRGSGARTVGGTWWREAGEDLRTPGRSESRASQPICSDRLS